MAPSQCERCGRSLGQEFFSCQACHSVGCCTPSQCHSMSQRALHHLICREFASFNEGSPSFQDPRPAEEERSTHTLVFCFPPNATEPQLRWMQLMCEAGRSNGKPITYNMGLIHQVQPSHGEPIIVCNSTVPTTRPHMQCTTSAMITHANSCSNLMPKP